MSDRKKASSHIHKIVELLNSGKSDEDHVKILEDIVEFHELRHGWPNNRMPWSEQKSGYLLMWAIDEDYELTARYLLTQGATLNPTKKENALIKAITSDHGKILAMFLRESMWTHPSRIELKQFERSPGGRKWLLRQQILRKVDDEHLDDEKTRQWLIKNRKTISGIEDWEETCTQYKGPSLTMLAAARDKSTTLQYIILKDSPGDPMLKDHWYHYQNSGGYDVFKTAVVHGSTNVVGTLLELLDMNMWTTMAEVLNLFTVSDLQLQSLTNERKNAEFNNGVVRGMVKNHFLKDADTIKIELLDSKQYSDEKTETMLKRWIRDERLVEDWYKDHEQLVLRALFNDKVSTARYISRYAAREEAQSDIDPDETESE